MLLHLRDSGAGGGGAGTLHGGQGSDGVFAALGAGVGRGVCRGGGAVCA